MTNPLSDDAIEFVERLPREDVVNETRMRQVFAMALAALQRDRGKVPDVEFLHVIVRIEPVE